ncbi:MAG: ribulose-phosphate 3-epimerase [Pyrinomonadaceae bacterium]|nr:ribulose-phosphate 3-epimerase [Pyrinomonadaceae bacterium]
MVEIAPSILSADFANLGEEIRAIEKGGASFVHFDVMDGHFVPNITIGLPVLQSIKKCTKLPVDAHLMISEPNRYAVEFVKAGASMVSIHVEADNHAHRTLTAIREAGALAGIAINPGTSLSTLDEILHFADFVLVMSVNPGFGGQKFIKNSFEKIRRLKAMIRERNLETKIEIDGGVDKTNIAQVAAAGAEIIVAGSAVFGTEDSTAAVRQLIDAATIWT